MTPATLEIALIAVRAYRGNLRSAEALAALSELKAAKTQVEIAVIRFEPHPTDNCLWRFTANGPWLHYASVKRSFVPWAYWMCLRDGEAQAGWVASPGAIRKAKPTFITWLNRVGAHALAREVARVSIARNGDMRYSPDVDSSRIVFGEDFMYAPSTHEMPG